MPVNLAKKKPVSIGKGAPPRPDEASRNLDKAADGDTTKITFNAPKSWHKQLRTYALEHDTTVTQVLIEAFQAYRERVP